MKQPIPAQAAIQVIVDLLRRVPMTPAEQVGVQCAIDRLEELTVKKPEASDAIPPNPAG